MSLRQKDHHTTKGGGGCAPSKAADQLPLYAELELEPDPFGDDDGNARSGGGAGEIDSLETRMMMTSSSHPRDVTWLRRFFTRYPYWKMLVLACLSVALASRRFPPASELPLDSTATRGRNDEGGGSVQIGFDGSECLGASRAGVIFKDVDGTPKDPLSIFADRGYEWSRVRVMVDPDGTHGLFQDLAYVTEMAQAVKSTHGMKLLIDFHYSHWWADPGDQRIPLSWRGDDDDGRRPLRRRRRTTDRDDDDVDADLAALEDRVYNHTRAVVDALVAQGTPPDAVQFGNEVNRGMLWNAGRVSDDGTNMDSFVRLTNAAYRALEDSVTSEMPKNEDGGAEKEVAKTTTTPLPLVVVHLASGGQTAFTERWLSNFTDAGGRFDVVGLSHYPMWHGSLNDLADNLDNLKRVYPNKTAWIVETAYYWTGGSNGGDEGDDEEDGEDGGDDDNGDAENDDALPFDRSVDGQASYLRALRKVLDDYGCETAVFYWGSHWTQPERWMATGDGGETWEDTADRSLFDRNATALRGIDALFVSAMSDQ